MGFLGKIGDAIQKIDSHISSDSEIVGKRFEDHVQKLFSTKYFKVVEKTHSFKTNTERYVESSKTRILFLNTFQQEKNLLSNVNTGRN